MKKLFLFFTGFALTLLGIFVVLPQAVTLLGFSGERFFSGELWRILSFPLAHISFAHLSENLLALFVVTLLAYELELSFKQFLFIFALTGIVIAFFSGIFFPSLLLAGSSLGIYSLFGALSLKEQEVLPKSLFLGIFGIIIFLNVAYTLYTSNDYVQPAYHAAGFIGGIALVGLTQLRRKKRILQ